MPQNLPWLAGKLSRFGGGLCVWMYFSQREVSKDKPQLFSELLLKRFDDRVCTSTVRTFVVAIFYQSKLGRRRDLMSGRQLRPGLSALP
jgi:hypothetical protein